jgi:hypothetical protein
MEPSVKFLNIEYVFNRTFDVYLWLKYIVLFKLGGKDIHEYLAEHSGDAYDGMRDRFHIADMVGSSSTGTSVASTSDNGGSGLSYIWHKIMSLFGSDTASVASSGTHIVSNTSSSGLIIFLGYIRDIMTILALIAISIYIYSIIGWKEAVAEYFANFDKAHKKPIAPAFKNTKLATIDAYMASNDSAQWRLAILEADSMLADLLKTLPIAGIDVGEKLTNADKKSFQTLDDAWEAHKVRNRIAHEGSDFVLTEHLARQTITQFKNVFKEFEYGV